MNMTENKIIIDISDLTSSQIEKFIGVYDENIKFLEELYDCHITFHHNQLFLLSDKEIKEEIVENIKDLIMQIKMGHDIDITKIKQNQIDKDNNINSDYLNKTIGYTSLGKPIKAKTYNQYELIKAIEHNDIIISIGPAGTGKTFLAILLAVKAYKEGKINKIILSRPAVEAGESLGFLPGDLKEKVDPYLMPLYDSLNELLGNEQVERLIEKGCIEVIPLAYMRGRTLNDSFILLDEAQNTTTTQMLMFLTRLGFNSKMIINGDITQIDLNLKTQKSGLVSAINSLHDINKLAILKFNNDDIVRNPLVQKIIESYHE